jgi:hypothetical protein
MTGDFSPRLDVLPEPQRQLWHELSAAPRSFVLDGGTAIAPHLAALIHGMAGIVA